MKLHRLYKSLKSEEEPADQVVFPYLYFPASRHLNDLSTSLSNETASKIYDDVTLKYQTIFGGNDNRNFLLSMLAMYRFGLEYKWEEENKSSENIRIFSERMEEAGLGCTAFLNESAGEERFNISLKKLNGENSYGYKHASSGDKQLVSFLLSLSFLEIKNSLIIIDEPEQNLHSRWQKLLYKVLDEFAKDRGCQIIISMVEKIARYEAPKYLHCYLDVLNVHLTNIDRLDLKEDIAETWMFLEFGVSKRTELSLMSLGMSRSSVMVLSDKIKSSELNEQQAYKWLITEDWHSYGFSELVTTEIKRILEQRASQFE
ncbi:MAG: AAA family ATPase [Rickettsiales bacterium]|nr:AAA family ATPase [Rickettsiales bacterium]